MISYGERLLICGLLLHIVCIAIGYAAPQGSNQPDYSSVGVNVTKVKSKPADCGKTSKNKERIFGGKFSDLGSWPWMVALGYRKGSDQKTYFLCGATLIADEWILTVARCAEGSSSQVLSTARLGDLDLDEKVKDGATPVDAPIESTFVHPQYKADPRNYDIALLQLKNPVKFTRLIKPICLLSGAQYESDEYYRTKSPFAIGWGLTEEASKPTALKEVTFRVQELKTCSDKYSSLGGKTFTDNILCAGEPGKDSCQGDSGGPLMFINATEARFYLGGIVSAGKECGGDYPGLYMKVAKFIPWINKVTGLNF